MNLPSIPDISALKPIGKKAVAKIGEVVTNPNALTAGAVVGLFSTTGLAINATFKASKELEEKLKEDEELDIFDKLRIVSKYYRWTAVSAALTATMTVASNRASAAHSALIASGCAIIQEAAEKAEKGLETSEKRNEEKTVELNKALMKDVPPDRYMWCRDLQTGALFKTNKEILDHADGQIRERFQQDYATTINDLYSMIGVDRIEIGDDYVITETNRVHPLDITPCFAEDGSIMLTLFYFQDNRVRGYY